MKIFQIVFPLVMLVAISAPANESRNGGDIIVDHKKSSEFIVSDFHFVALPSERFGLDDELLAEIRRLLDFPYRRLNLPMINDKRKEFLKDYIANSYVEYRFVTELPRHCGFIPAENLTTFKGTRVHAGCTDGYLTYLVPKVFKGLSLTMKALFIIHERLHAFAESQPYDFKTEYVTALYILNGKYLPALENRKKGPVTFEFTDDELRVLNHFHTRVRQLSGKTSDDDILGEAIFTKEGGLFVTHDTRGNSPSSWIFVNPTDIAFCQPNVFMIGTVLDSSSDVAERAISEFRSNSISACGLVLDNFQYTFFGTLELKNVLESRVSNVSIDEFAKADMAEVKKAFAENLPISDFEESALKLRRGSRVIEFRHLIIENLEDWKSQVKVSARRL